MPRPRKWRRVCCMPGNRRFGPLDGESKRADTVEMTVDEFEAIRLIDLEGLNQEECAERMDVARTTVQSIYSGARFKLAKALVDGANLLIQGGEYRLCEEGESCGHGRGCCHGHGHGRRAPCPDSKPDSKSEQEGK